MVGFGGAHGKSRPRRPPFRLSNIVWSRTCLNSVSASPYRYRWYADTLLGSRFERRAKKEGGAAERQHWLHGPVSGEQFVPQFNLCCHGAATILSCGRQPNRRLNNVERCDIDIDTHTICGWSVTAESMNGE